MAGIALTPPKFRQSILAQAGTFCPDVGKKLTPSCVNRY
ncbi:hypothetical protein ACNKHM_24760 [Shigella sonnei]